MMKLFSRILAAACLLLTVQMHGQNTASQESRKAKLEKEIEQLEIQLQENSAKSTNALNTLTLVRKQISSRKELLEEGRHELDSVNKVMLATRAEAAKLQARLDSMMLYYTRLVKNAYRNRDARIWYLYLFSSRNFGQATRRYSYLKGLSATMNERATRMKEVRVRLDSEMTRLTALRAKVERLVADRQREMTKLQAQEKSSDKLVARLKQDKNFYQRQLNTKKRQVEALNKEIERIIAQAMQEAQKAASGSKGTSKSAPVDYKLAESFAANKGKLPWPADGPVVEKFGKHNHPVYTKLAMPFNNGVNIGLSRGAEVKAVFDGEVKRVIVMPGYNKCVLVQHGNYFTFYCKLGDVSVKAGDKVKTGSRIGVVDTIDGQTQLHFQVWQEKTPQNPEIWLRPR